MTQEKKPKIKGGFGGPSRRDNRVCTCHIDLNGPVGCYHDDEEMARQEQEWDRQAEELSKPRCVCTYYNGSRGCGVCDPIDDDGFVEGRFYVPVSKEAISEPKMFNLGDLIRKIKAEAWQEGYDAASEDVIARHPQSTGAWNPYEH